MTRIGETRDTISLKNMVRVRGASAVTCRKMEAAALRDSSLYAGGEVALRAGGSAGAREEEEEEEEDKIG
jgi:hypothetical protein